MNSDVTLSFDIETLDWKKMTDLYRDTFGTMLSSESMEKIFRNSYVACTAHSGDRLIGAVYAISDGVLDATIHGLAVTPDYQKRGIATLMLKALVERLGGISLLLTTKPDYIDYYRRLGFKHHISTMAMRFPEDEVE